jgi:hypothetical protein
VPSPSGGRNRDAHVDLEVAGLARVRLVDPAPVDVAAVEWRLGGVQVPATGDPDLLIELVDPSSQPARLIGTDGAGYTPSAYVAKGARAGPRSTIDFDASPLRVTSTRGAGSVPYLAALLNLAVIGRDILPLHAATFELDGIGIVACGWAGAGKSEALLAFMRHGARGIADEWTYVTPAGRLHGVGTPVRLQAWHVAQLPEQRRRLPPASRARLLAGSGAMALRERMSGRGRPLALMRKALGLAGPWSHVDRSPTDLFDARWGGTTQLELVFFLQPTSDGRISVTEQDPAILAERMTFAHQHHRRAILAAYQEFRHAFPERSSRLVDELEERERGLLRRAFAGRPTYLVEHPAGGPIDRIYRSLHPFSHR